MKKKCKHYYLNILRELNISHITEVSVRYDEDDQYYETTVRSDWSNEWNIKDYNRIRVICSDCEKEWVGKKCEDFPKWLQQVLEQEESHFKDL